MEFRAVKFCSDCCKDFKTVFVFVPAHMVNNIDAFEIIKKSQAKTDICWFSQKLRLESKKSLEQKSFTA